MILPDIKFKLHGQTTGGVVVSDDFPMVELDDLLGKCQSDTGARQVLGGRFIHFVIQFKNFLQFVGGYTNAFVLNADAKMTRCGEVMNVYSYFLTLWRKLKSIGQEIIEY